MDLICCPAAESQLILGNLSRSGGEKTSLVIFFFFFFVNPSLSRSESVTQASQKNSNSGCPLPIQCGERRAPGRGGRRYEERNDVDHSSHLVKRWSNIGSSSQLDCEKSLQRLEIFYQKWICDGSEARRTVIVLTSFSFACYLDHWVHFIHPLDHGGGGGAL